MSRGLVWYTFYSQVGWARNCLFQDINGLKGAVEKTEKKLRYSRT